MPLPRPVRRLVTNTVAVLTIPATAAVAAAQPPTTTPPPAAPAAPKPVEWPQKVQGRFPADWVGDFRSPDPTVRESAIRVLPIFGPDIRRVAVKPLIDLIGDPDPGVRTNAVLVLGQIGFNLPEQLPDVHSAARALGSAMTRVGSGSVIRLHAARVVGTFGAEGHEAVNALCSSADDTSWETRAIVADALGRVAGPVYPPAGTTTDPTKPLVPKRPANSAAMTKLKTLLSDPSFSVRREAAQALLMLGPPYVSDVARYEAAVHPYVTVVTERLKTDAKGEKDPSVRIWLMMLQSMYDDRTLSQNVQKIASQTELQDASLQVQALTALSLIGPKSKDALPQVTDCLRSQEPLVVVGAVAALLAIGEQHRATAIGELDRMYAAATNKDWQKFYADASAALRAGKKEIEGKKDDTKKP